MNRGTLRGAAVSMLVIGLGITAVPFVASLGPNAKGDAALTRISISDLAPGHARLHTLGEPLWGNDVRHGVLLVHRADGRFQAWDVPVREGRVLMPQFRHWFGALQPCANFGPTVREGMIDELAPITCHDVELPAQRAEGWRWSLDGKSFGVAEDLTPSVGQFERAHFVVGKRR